MRVQTKSEKSGKIADQRKYLFTKVQCDFGTLDQNNFKEVQSLAQIQERD